MSESNKTSQTPKSPRPQDGRANRKAVEDESAAKPKPSHIYTDFASI